MPADFHFRDSNPVNSVRNLFQMFDSSHNSSLQASHDSHRQPLISLQVVHQSLHRKQQPLGSNDTSTSHHSSSSGASQPSTSDRVLQPMSSIVLPNQSVVLPGNTHNMVTRSKTGTLRPRVEVNLGRRLSNRCRKAHVSSSPASHDPVPSFLPLFFFFFVGVWLVQPADSSSPTSGRCHPYLVAITRLSPLLRSHLPLSL
ncbi:hypothetical protein LWI29_009879 [Acer saccharum]|uniref:Uncharacterized protein n=1 Tax=Acer saccharum TaxID=4024 RepID=A0AA39SC77_ACESA|nr:hypothetical protein LWI29_009879 [Acer saccharum]